jgi:hypothetical protein
MQYNFPTSDAHTREKDNRTQKKKVPTNIMLSWQLQKKLGLIGICVERRPSHLYHIDILGVFIQGLHTFLEREIVRLINPV